MFIYHIFSVVTGHHILLLFKIAELMQSSMKGIFTANILKYKWKIFHTLGKTTLILLLVLWFNKN